MKKLIFALAMTSLIAACGDDDETPSNNTNNNTTTTNNGTTSTNNGTTTTNNGTTTTNNGTTGGTNNTTGATACETYCADYETNCGTQFGTDYTDAAGCETACAAFAEGTAGDMAGDNLACRQYHTGAAKADPATHCTHAGKVPTDACVDAVAPTACETYCADYETNCAVQFVVDYTTAAGCETACAEFAEGTAGDMSGDNLACRQYHTGAAANDALTHCPHAGKTPTDACVDPA